MTSPNGFQNVVKSKAAPAVAGDFASVNPRASVLATEGNLVAPAGGLNVGTFAFVNPADQSVHQGYTSGYQIGFFARNAQALITAFLDAATMLVPSGFMVTLFDEGEFWAYFGDGATAGQTVYADETTGAAQSGSGTPTSFTGSVGFAGTASFATNVMTVVTQTAGSLIEVGDVVTSAGVTGGTTITALLTGTPGAVGSTYSLSTAPGTIATQAATTTSSTLNVTAVSAGSLSVGDVISGTGVTAGTTIAAFGTGVGGVGTYTLGIPGGAPFHTASETITVPAGNVATNYTVRTNCNPGELAIISSWGN
jgi:hypothetical protein